MSKKTFSKFVAVFLCALTLFSTFAFSVSAATSGGKGSTTITVKTKANYLYPGASSITLKQNKQTFTYKHLFNNTTKTTSGYYGHYDIKAYNETKGKTEETINWDGGQTKKISLKPNCTYKITVSYNANETDIFKPKNGMYSWIKTSSPSWQVSSTWKVSSYS